ncbi:MAG: hypothetical protein Q9167_002171 [Letrouitia subvulpina]
MSSNRDREPADRSVVDEKGNPFVTFRRFADEQMSSFMRSIANFPSHFFDLNGNTDRAHPFVDWERKWKQEAEDFEKSLNDFFSGHGKKSQPPSESTDLRPLHVKDRTDQAQEQAVREWFQSGNFASWMRDALRQQAQSRQEPAERCPYRPAGDKSYRVRPSFCDVLPASEMQAYFPQLHAQCQENLPSHPSESSANEQPVEDKFDSGLTELDLYAKLLSDQSPSWDQEPAPPSTQLPKSEPSHPLASAQEEVPRVISTLTTTERSTLPDGSMHTKVLLKKRFANGGEESTESIYTTSGAQEQGALHEEVPSPPQPSPQAINSSISSALGHDGQTKKRICDHIREKKKGGWFWS